MKKIIFAILMGACFMAGSFAAEQGKTAVVYFSATGTTEKLAKEASQAMGADVIQIVPEQNYTASDLNWRDKKSRTSVECNDSKARPKIASNVNISDYDTVILCYPIWWSGAPKIIYTFVESQDWSGKRLVTLCTSGGSGLGRSGTDVAKHAKGAAYKGGRDFTGKNGPDVKKYVEGLLK